MKIRLLFHTATVLQLILLIYYRMKVSTFMPPIKSTEGLLLDSMREMSEGCIFGTLGIWLFAYAEMKRRDKQLAARTVV